MTRSTPPPSLLDAAAASLKSLLLSGWEEEDANNLSVWLLGKSLAVAASSMRIS